MKLGIFCNFGIGHIGGSEIVVENIAILLSQMFGYSVSIYSYISKEKQILSNVKSVSCGKNEYLLGQINENDHILIYSDSFWGFDTVVENICKIVPDVSVALVGAYHMKSNHDILLSVLKAQNRFRIITHSSGDDYKWALNSGFSPFIIPNGVNLSEFKNNNNIDFRSKYNIKNKHIILNVSNWFYGKNQQIIPDICYKLKEFLEDFVVIQISNRVQYPYEKIFLSRCIKKSNGTNIKFLRDIPREDVVSAFKCSDVFLFTSCKEVAPLVILESRAAKLPWVSLRVGNIEEQSGGIPISFSKADSKGYVIIEDKVIDDYVSAIGCLVKMSHLREKTIEDGQRDIDKLDWSNIVPSYDRVFNSEISKS